jgi:hypothetical protein
MFSSLANATYAALSRATLRTTTRRALTFRSTRMHRTADQLSGPNAAGSSRFAKSVACTIATAAGRPDPAQSIATVAVVRLPPLSSTSFHGGPDGPRRLAPLPPIRCPRSPLFFGPSGELGRLPTERDQVLAKDRCRYTLVATQRQRGRPTRRSLGDRDPL